jgi:uncharacterized protein YgiM (DUF1202 family)
MNWIRISFAWVVLSAAGLRAGPFEVTVVGDGVNLRNGSDLESDVVGSSDYGDTLTAVGLDEKWVRVRPPASVAVWVYGPLLFEEKEVRAPVLNVRAGPGTNFPVLGQLERGDAVQVEEASGDWRRIAAPQAVTLWISRAYVQVPPEAEQAVAVPAPTPGPVVDPTPSPTPVPAPEPTPAPTPEPLVEIRTVEKVVEVPVPVTPTPAPTVVPPPELNLVPLKGQGTVSIRRGMVKAYLLAGSSPSRFMLVRGGPGGRETSLAYLLGDAETLKRWAGRPVVVRGRDFWVTGQKLPTTRVDSIQPVEDGVSPE